MLPTFPVVSGLVCVWNRKLFGKEHTRFVEQCLSNLKPYLRKNKNKTHMGQQISDKKHASY